MLIGDPGTGKGTTCAILQTILQHSGFTRFAPDRTTKEKFLVDLEEGFDVDSSDFGGGRNPAPDEFFNSPMPTETSSPADGHTSDVLILAEELSDFFGSDNLDFIALLTKLWSFVGPYTQKIKTGRSVRVSNPCINMYAATTHDSFQLTFPSRLLGTGFLARFILVYGATSSAPEIAFPSRPMESGKTQLGDQLRKIRDTTTGEFTIPDSEKVVFESILRGYSGPDDGRFKHYKSRRFVQLLKLAMIHAASRGEREITRRDAINANTLLYATEQDMGKALGEFGKSRNAEVSNKIMQLLYSSHKPVSALEIWKFVSSDLAKMTELADIMDNLKSAEKIRFIDTKDKKTSGFLANLKPPASKGTGEEKKEELLNAEYLDYLMR
jgi:hypothetical protein